MRKLYSYFDFKYKRGFTLIELLVVIAIVGILSSIVLVSLNSARGKSTDAAIKASLTNVRVQTSLWYEGNGSYGPNALLCTTFGSMFTDSIITRVILFVTQNNGGGATQCRSTATSWIINSPLKTSGYWCIDSTGASVARGGVVPNGQYTCLP